MNNIIHAISKRILAALSSAVMFIASSPAVSAERPDFTVETHTPPHIVFLGDSIVSGYGLDGYSPDDKSKCGSYANVLTMVFDSALPEQAGFSSVNLGKDGETSKGLLKKLKEGQMDQDLNNADAIVVSIGGNDLLYPLYDLLFSDEGFGDKLETVLSLSSLEDENLAIFEQNLPQIVDELYARTENDDVKLFFQTLYDPFEESFKVLRDLSADKIGKLNEIIVSASEDGSRYTVVDVAAGFVGKSEELTRINDSDIHPNFDGHAEIAKILQPVIESETYTYYDAEAAMQYELDMEQQRREKEEKDRSRKKLITIISGAAVLLTGAGIITAALRKRRK